MALTTTNGFAVHAAPARDGTALTFDEIQEVLPQRFPLLMVDRVLSWEAGHIRALRNITGNDPTLAAHFPGRAIVPGALILEGIAQCALLLSHLTSGARTRGEPLLGTARCRFVRPVVPGDQLHYNVAIVKTMGSAAYYRGVATVGDLQVAECDITVSWTRD